MLSSIIGNTECELYDASFTEYVIYQGEEVDEDAKINKPSGPFVGKNNFEVMKQGAMKKDTLRVQAIPNVKTANKGTFVNFRNTQQMLETRNRMRTLQSIATQFDIELERCLERLRMTLFISMMSKNLMYDLLDLAQLELNTFKLNQEFFSLFDAIDHVFSILGHIAALKRITLEVTQLSEEEQECY